MWEEGGAGSNTGHATIITDHYGNKVKPIYIRGVGHLSCGEHALVPIKPDYRVIKASQHHGDFTIDIYAITGAIEENEAEVRLLNHFSRGEWDKVLPADERWMEALYDALVAAQEKAMDYHCRRPYFVQE